MPKKKGKNQRRKKKRKAKRERRLGKNNTATATVIRAPKSTPTAKPWETSSSPSPSVKSDVATKEPVATFAIRGLIVRTKELSEPVTVSLSGGKTMTAEVAGDAFEFLDLTAGLDYSVKATYGDVVFEPAQRDIANLQADAAGQDFAVKTLAIRGTIDRPEGVDDSVKVELAGGAAKSTDETGDAFEFVDVPAGPSYTVTASSGKLLFDNSTIVLGDLKADADVTFKIKTHTLTVELTPDHEGVRPDLSSLRAGVSVKLSGDATRESDIDPDGTATFENLPAGKSYNVKLEGQRFVVAEDELSIANLSKDETLEFVATSYAVNGLIDKYNAERDSGIRISISQGETVLHKADVADASFDLGRYLAGLEYLLKPTSKTLLRPTEKPINKLEADVSQTFRVRSFTINGVIYEQFNAKKPGRGRYQSACEVKVSGDRDATVTPDDKGGFLFPPGHFRKGGLYQLDVVSKTKKKHDFLNVEDGSGGPWDVESTSGKVTDKVSFTLRVMLSSETNPEGAKIQWGEKTNEFVNDVKTWASVTNGSITLDEGAIRGLFTARVDEVTGVGVVKRLFVQTKGEALKLLHESAKEKAEETFAHDDLSPIYSYEKTQLLKKHLDSAKESVLKKFSAAKLRKASLNLMRARTTIDKTPPDGASGGMEDLSDVSGKLKDGGMKLEDVMKLIPKGQVDDWKPNAKRFDDGFKYEWVNHQGEKCHVHAHTKDKNHSSGNSGTGTVVRIQIGLNWLKSDGSTTTNIFVDEAHIPLWP